MASCLVLSNQKAFCLTFCVFLTILCASAQEKNKKDQNAHVAKNERFLIAHEKTLSCYKAQNTQKVKENAFFISQDKTCCLQTMQKKT